LRLWEFGNVDEIVQKTRTEELIKARLQQGPGKPAQVDPYIENKMMVLEGKPVMPESTDDHYIHIAVHQEALGQGRDDLVEKHMAAHQIYMSQGNFETPTSADQGQGAMGPDGQPLPPAEDMMRNKQIGAMIGGAGGGVGGGAGGPAGMNQPQGLPGAGPMMGPATPA
jgi:hypothetical protein